ncbi:carboxypeptidase A1 [Nematostella vectensis]|uniref:carboxypeptidase A1 n=1 Tax=Nematostella vectensis TaxID=45351 RepID=UPI00207757DB|nr:carboxypeptidase A1 [Nematostella vectensis]XP_048586377.1 carboxypeptidase A1 [Nematostella vectensis]XP_048586378.1 carboxypeptidase A1 [Nematostella vectensis]
MDCPIFKASANLLSWVFLLAFLPNFHVTKGTGVGFDVFNQKSSKEKYVPDYRFYHNLSRLNECIHDLVSQFPDVLDTQMRFRSRWGLSQYVLHFTNYSTKGAEHKQKVRVLLSFGEHAAEFLPVESMIYLLRTLTRGLRDPFGSPTHNFTRFVLDNIDLYLISLFNPDGRAIIERTSNYCWSGTASEADLNHHLSSFSPVFPRQVLVEPECKVVKELLNSMKFDAVVSFHSGDKQMYIPVLDNIEPSSESNIPDQSDVLSFASQLNDLSNLYLKHTHVKSSQYSYAYSLFSYASFSRQVPFSFLVSLWGNGRGVKQKHNCFSVGNPRGEQLQKTLESLHPFYTVLFRQLVSWKENKLKVDADVRKAIFQGHSRAGFYSSKVFLFLIFLAFAAYFVAKFKMPFGWRLIYRRQRRIVSLRSLSSAFSFLLVAIL